MAMLILELDDVPDEQMLFECADSEQLSLFTLLLLLLCDIMTAWFQYQEVKASVKLSGSHSVSHLLILRAP